MLRNDRYRVGNPLDKFYELKCGMNQVGAETHLINVDELNGIAHWELD